MVFNTDIDYTLNVRVDEGPQLQKIDAIEVGAYEVFKCTCPKDSGTVELDLQSGLAGDVSFFAAYSDNYTSLTFTIDGGSAITFNGPIMLIGAGAVAQLGATLLAIEFTNAGAVSVANIVVYVGRDPVIAGV